MATEQSKQPAPQVDIKWLWSAIVVPLVAMAVWWGVFTTRLEALECRVAEQGVKIEQYSESFTSLRVQLAEIQRDVSYIRLQTEKTP
jgi:hypothetical protein